MEGVCDRLKQVLPLVCHQAQFCRSSLKRVVISRRKPQNWERWGFVPLGRGRGWPSEDKPPSHMCYDIKFCSSASKGVRINIRGLPKIRERPLAMGRDLTSKDKPPHYMCYHVKFGSSESKCVCKNTREPQTLGIDGHRSLRCGVIDPLEIRPSQHVLFCQIWSF